MPTTLNPLDIAGGTLSELNTRYTMTAGSGWNGGVRATRGKLATSANNYFEFEVNSSTYIMCGFSTLAGALTNAHTQTTSWFYYSVDGSKYSANSSVAYGASFTAGDRIGSLIKNGKLYWSKNGVWQNSGDPVAETGFAYSGLTSVLYPSFGTYITGNSIKVWFDEADWLYIPPAGASPYDTPGTVTVTLLDQNSDPVANTLVSWAWFEQTTVHTLSTPVNVGTATTSALGVLTLNIPDNNLANGATGLLVISNTDGVAVNQCSSHCAPVTIVV